VSPARLTATCHLHSISSSFSIETYPLSTRVISVSLSLSFNWLSGLPRLPSQANEVTRSLRAFDVELRAVVERAEEVRAAVVGAMTQHAAVAAAPEGALAAAAEAASSFAALSAARARALEEQMRSHSDFQAEAWKYNLDVLIKSGGCVGGGKRIMECQCQ
jgi:hypothetical protein